MASSLSKYSKYLSSVSSRREPSAIRSLQPLMRLPGMISLAGGLPNPSTFPFTAMNFDLRDGTKIELSEEEVKAAFQYSATNGIPQLVDLIKEHQQREHGKIGYDWDILLSTGSQDALSKCFEMILDENDSILLENPTYSGALAAINPLKCAKVEVECDDFGIVPEKLSAQLHELSTSRYGKVAFPKCLYTIPTGQNPSGATLTVDRKRKIYELAKQFQFLILEDDPYHYLQLDPEQYKNNKSFLSMDTDGLVLRFDSLSKVLSSGLRIGWCTGPAELVTRINYHMQANELHTSGLSQMIAYKVLSHWGNEGFQKHVSMIQEFYRARRDTFVGLVDKHLADYVTYTFPKAGMFLWMTLKDIEDSKSFIEQKAREKNVLMVPGQAFQPNNRTSACVRASFSTESDENFEKAIKRLAELLAEHRTGNKK